MKKLFAIVGESDWGKSNTLYELFKRKQFMPLKKPITVEGMPYKFIVINASNEDRPLGEFLERLEKVLNEHEQEKEVIYVITVSLTFTENNHYVIPVLDFLNALSNEFDIHYIILNRGWRNGALSDNSINRLKQIVNDDDKIHEFHQEINMLKTAFAERTKEISKTIQSLI